MGSEAFVYYLIASLLISYALRPKQKSPPPPAFDSFDFPQVEDGTPQCVAFGDVWSGDWTVLAVGNYRTEQIIGEGGKK